MTRKIGEEHVIAIKGEACVADVSRFGAKAAGLAALDHEWTPPFIAIAVGCHVDLAANRTLSRVLQAALPTLEPCADGVLVRSSAVNEGLERRGTLESTRCKSSVVEIAQAMRRIADDTPSHEQDQLAFVIQRWIPGAAVGHLSNERRVSRDKRGWLCEAELPVSTSDRTFRLRIDSDVPSRAELSCGSFDELEESLRGIARVFARQGDRVHLEWVWDGARAWIVQCDRDETRREPAPGVIWTGPPAATITEPLSLFTRADRRKALSVFPKVNHVRIFRECDLPHGDIRVLADADIIKRLAAGRIGPKLREDLRSLVAAPLVIRTDFKGATDQPAVLSLRTDTCLTISELESFMIGAARAVLEKGHKADDMAFLAHRFLRTQAGAFSYARPKSNLVNIDATWGLPDGLLFHPHDSYRVDIANASVSRYLRCKTDYIDVDQEGKWQSRPAGVSWDWKPTLSDEQAIVIAKMSTQLADHLGKAIEIMFLISAGSHDDTPILPWWFTSDEKRILQVQAAPGFYVGDKVVIRDEDDLARLASSLDSNPARPKIALTLRPRFELLRSRPFIQAIAKLAKDWSLPIELEGSQLSHAYYLLESAGAGIRCVNPWREPERRQSFGKLVRDLVPVKIERHGEHAAVYHAERHQLVSLIKDKVVEEALEYYWESDREKSIEELADILELLETAAKIHKVGFETVRQAAAKKRAERGGFEAGVVLVETRYAPEGPRVEPSEARARALDFEPGSRRNRLSARRRVLRLPGRRLVLPLVPPTGWPAGTPNTLSFDADDEVVVTYGSNEIVLQIRPKAFGPGRNQMSIPGLDVP